MSGFSYDGPIMSVLSKIVDLLILNVLILVFSIPLFTIGTALTAAHFTALKIRRGEGYVWSCFWRSFKQNFKQSTCIWFVFVIYAIVVFVFYNIAAKMGGTMASILSVIIVGSLILVAFLYIWVIPLQARFINPIMGTFKNSYFMAFRYFIRTLFMALFNVLPIVTLYVCVETTQLKGLGIWLMMGVSIPVYLCVMMYDKIFEKLEETVE